MFWLSKIYTVYIYFLRKTLTKGKIKDIISKDVDFSTSQIIEMHIINYRQNFRSADMPKFRNPGGKND